MSGLSLTMEDLRLTSFKMFVHTADRRERLVGVDVSGLELGRSASSTRVVGVCGLGEASVLPLELAWPILWMVCA